MRKKSPPGTTLTSIRRGQLFPDRNVPRCVTPASALLLTWRLQSVLRKLYRKLFNFSTSLPPVSGPKMRQSLELYFFFSQSSHVPNRYYCHSSIYVSSKTSSEFVRFNRVSVNISRVGNTILFINCIEIVESLLLGYIFLFLHKYIVEYFRNMSSSYSLTSVKYIFFVPFLEFFDKSKRTILPRFSSFLLAN